MQTITFSYRSNKDKSNLEIRFTCKNDLGKRISFYSRTKDLEVSKEFWNEYKSKTNFRDNEKINLKTKIDKHLASLKTYLNEEISKASVYNKKWFKKIVEQHYKPIDETQNKKLPTRLVDYFDVYIENQKGEIKESSIKKYKVIQSKLKRLEKHFDTTLKIEYINENFKSQFKNFCDLYQYSQNTRQRELVLIKTVCFNARYNGLKTHNQLEGLKFRRETIKHPYLNTDELEKIKDKEFNKDYLDNARDWLIISCYTGQRVSDFMKFTKENIRTEDGKRYLDFKQQKTNNLTTIPVLKQVDEVLNKRGGEFPRPISDQKYNDYIKEVCELCGIDEVMTGKKRISIAPERVKPKKHHYRDVITTAPKHEFISSHIGRRSFATNYYGKVPTTYLIGITNHSTEAQFLNYIQKAEGDLAKDAHKYFN